MTDLTLIPAPRPTLPPPPCQARHLIDGRHGQRRMARLSDRVSPSHGVVVSRSAKGGEAETPRPPSPPPARPLTTGAGARLPGKARAAVLLKVADLIEANVERMALIETLESGKPISQARGEVGGAADLWRYAAALARTHARATATTRLGPDMLAVVLKEPIGVVSIITPWNFPFWILSQKLPFALAAGCTCVVKPSEMTPSTTAMLGELLIEAGLPAGVVNIVLGYGQPGGRQMASTSRTWTW